MISEELKEVEDKKEIKIYFLFLLFRGLEWNI